MAERLTWRDVTAPDFSGAAAATAVAGRLLGEGFASLGTTLNGRTERKKEGISNEAQLNALKFTDVGAWDRAMAGGAGAALGVDPRMLNQDGLDFIQGYRGSLLDDASTQAGTLQTQAATANTISSMENADIVTSDNHAADQFKLGEDMYGAGRTRTADAKGDAKILMDEASEREVQEIVLGSLDKEDDLNKIINDKSLSPEKRASKIAAFNRLAETGYTPSFAAQDEVASNPKVNGILAVVGNYEADKAWRQAGDSDSVLFNQAMDTYANAGDPVPAMMANIEADYNSTLTNGEGGKINFGNSAGAITGNYNDLVEQFPNLPKGVIAGVMQESMKQGMWILGENDILKLDTSKAVEALSKLADPTTLNRLKQNRQNDESEGADITDIKTDLARATSQLAQAITKGASEEVKKKLTDEIDIINGRAMKYFKETGGTDEAATQATEAIAAAANQGIAGQPGASVGNFQGFAAPRGGAPVAPATPMAPAPPMSEEELQRFFGNSGL